MKVNYRNAPGPGDEVTWPPYSGHSLDPRGPLDLDDEPDLSEIIDDLLAAAAENPQSEAVTWIFDTLGDEFGDERTTEIMVALRDGNHEELGRLFADHMLAGLARYRAESWDKGGRG